MLKYQGHRFCHCPNRSSVFRIRCTADLLVFSSCRWFSLVFLACESNKFTNFLLSVWITFRKAIKKAPMKFKDSISDRIVSINQETFRTMTSAPLVTVSSVFYTLNFTVKIMQPFQSLPRLLCSHAPSMNKFHGNCALRHPVFPVG